jgi:hypothetical protein
VHGGHNVGLFALRGCIRAVFVQYDAAGASLDEGCLFSQRRDWYGNHIRLSPRR